MHYNLLYVHSQVVDLSSVPPTNPSNPISNGHMQEPLKMDSSKRHADKWEESTLANKGLSVSSASSQVRWDIVASTICIMRGTYGRIHHKLILKERIWIREKAKCMALWLAESVACHFKRHIVALRSFFKFKIKDTFISQYYTTWRLYIPIDDQLHLLIINLIWSIHPSSYNIWI